MKEASMILKEGTIWIDQYQISSSTIPIEGKDGACYISIFNIITADMTQILIDPDGKVFCTKQTEKLTVDCCQGWRSSIDEMVRDRNEKIPASE